MFHFAICTSAVQIDEIDATYYVRVLLLATHHQLNNFARFEPEHGKDGRTVFQNHADLDHNNSYYNDCHVTATITLS